jgi:hypothetical protein
MHNAGTMRRFETSCDVNGALERLRQGHAVSRDHLIERPSLDEFHHEGGQLARFLPTVDGRDVGMVECGEYFGFALEAGAALGVPEKRVGQNFDGGQAAQVGVAHTIDLAHGAGAQEVEDLVGSDAVAGGEGHR